MTTAIEYRRWAAEDGLSYGSATGVVCETIREAEEYVSDYPLDSHRFATCGKVEVAYTTREETMDTLKAMLRDAGYSCDGDTWTRPGFTAQATYHDSLKYAMIYIYRANTHIAWAAGEGGYLHPSDRPEV